MSDVMEMRENYCERRETPRISSLENGTHTRPPSLPPGVTHPRRARRKLRSAQYRAIAKTVQFKRVLVAQITTAEIACTFERRRVRLPPLCHYYVKDLP